MNISGSPLRVLNDHTLPLRLRERLRDGHIAVAYELYDRPMQHSTRNRTGGLVRSPASHVTPAAGEATLVTFLAVAEQLYEQIAVALAQTGLSYARYELLLQLREADSPLAVGTLARCLACARSSITRLLERLEAEGLVQRVHDNGYGLRVQLTHTGCARADLGSNAMDLVRARFAASLSPPEWAKLSRLLTRIP